MRTITFTSHKPFNYRLLRNRPSGAATPIYPELHGGAFTGKPSSDSPDPLSHYVWQDSFLSSATVPLQCYHLLPVEAQIQGKLEEAKLEAENGSAWTFSGPAEIRFDFGIVSAAWLEFESDDFNGVVTAAISEYNRPARVNVGAEQSEKRASLEKTEKTYRLRLNKDYYEGVRFAWLFVEGECKPWTARNLRLCCQVKPTNYAGLFHSSDDVLNRIWHVGAYAVKLNLLKDQIGAILMERSDRHSWTGDALISQATSLTAFGNYPMIRHNTVRMESDTNGIEPYSLYWILAMLDYVRCSGDVAYLKSAAKLIAAKLQQAYEVVRDGKPLGFCGHDDRLGACFEEPNLASNHALFRALLVRTIKQVQDSLTWAQGSTEVANLCKNLLQELGTNDFPDGIHAANEAWLADYLTEAPNSLLACYGNERSAASYSPFNTAFLLDGMAKAKCWSAAVDCLHATWGGMLGLGATTFWESFRPEWKSIMQHGDVPPDGVHGYTSLCHPWSSYPTRWLMDHVLGIKAAHPGYSQFSVADNLEALGSVEGIIPTPHGPIQINREPGRIQLWVPRGTEATVSSTDEKFGPGAHDIACRPATSVTCADELPCAISNTHFQHGSSIPTPPELLGWYAFAANADLSDVDHLPAGVSVDTREGKAFGDPRRQHLTLPAEGSFLSASNQPCGALRSVNPEVVRQSFAIDCHMESEHEVGILCWDIDKSELRQVIEIMEINTLELSSSPVLLENFEAGCVLWFKSQKGFRLRVSNFPDADSTLSTLLFR